MKRAILGLSIIIFFGFSIASFAKTPSKESIQTLVRTMDLHKVYSQIHEMATQQIVNQNPNFEAYRSDIKRTFQNRISLEALLPEITRIYQKRFTEREILELTQFYRSDLGRKALNVLPELNAQLFQIGMIQSKRIAERLVKILNRKVARNHRSRGNERETYATVVQY